MDDQEETFSLTEAGMLIMSKVLYKAAALGLITPQTITASNVNDYIQTLADQDAIWVGSTIEERDQKLIMLAMVLPTLIPPEAINKKTEYN
jgi:hypothetical protein